MILQLIMKKTLKYAENYDFESTGSTASVLLWEMRNFAV